MKSPANPNAQNQPEPECLESLNELIGASLRSHNFAWMSAARTVRSMKYPPVKALWEEGLTKFDAQSGRTWSVDHTILRGLVSENVPDRRDRLRAEDLLARFEDLRRADQLDETAAELLQRAYV